MFAFLTKLKPLISIAAESLLIQIIFNERGEVISSLAMQIILASSVTERDSGEKIAFKDLILMHGHQKSFELEMY